MTVLDEILGGSDDDELEEGTYVPASALSAKGKKDSFLTDEPAAPTPSHGQPHPVSHSDRAGAHDRHSGHSRDAGSQKELHREAGRERERERTREWDRERDRERDRDCARGGEREKGREGNWDGPPRFECAASSRQDSAPRPLPGKVDHSQ